MKWRAVFLDRDGVLNEAIIKNGKPYPPATLQELTIAADVVPALKSLKAMGYLLIGASNQPDVARGTVERSVVESLNRQLMHKLPLDEIRVCYHDDRHECSCRKPAPGILLEAAYEHGIDLEQSFMIGDRWKDIEAGQQAGCKTIFLDKKYQEPGPSKPPDFVAESLLQAAQWIKNFPFAKGELPNTF
jgi:D-glycero-D-manno-heptose 1,7-bisphosphate phosphatase